MPTETNHAASLRKTSPGGKRLLELVVLVFPRVVPVRLATMAG
jgi:hypothetical protein